MITTVMEELATFNGRMWYKYIADAVDVHNEWNFSETVLYNKLDSTMVIIAIATKLDSNAQIQFAGNRFGLPHFSYYIFHCPLPDMCFNETYIIG